MVARPSVRPSNPQSQLFDTHSVSIWRPGTDTQTLRHWRCETSAMYHLGNHTVPLPKEPIIQHPLCKWQHSAAWTASSIKSDQTTDCVTRNPEIVWFFFFFFLAACSNTSILTFFFWAVPIYPGPGLDIPQHKVDSVSRNVRHTRQHVYGSFLGNLFFLVILLYVFLHFKSVPCHEKKIHYIKKKKL